MKTTMITNNIANPQRTTLAHLKDTEELTTEAVETGHEPQLPAQTANPRRTVLMDIPGSV
ncbi:hypothetical protein LHJ74_22385 [Streptomyces sp. N2-109]|uniref:Uncharacterized protein n=1 Tax=Streptomyces gossypii TaxID=2883101 RepID=A0ABT2JYV3_9ACTN|nr:hypothetical protein [Streptomyces gossypii]MCT2592624.1 hypothetical protein [Streptomyces gossypii]